jgi:RNA polymerase sigma-70 factor, ECF subfamily
MSYMQKRNSVFNEKAIIEGCKKYHKSAQMELYRKYAPLMRGICMRYVNHNNEVEDILHEGFLKVFNKIHEFKGYGSFEGWIKRVIINNAINQYYKNHKHKNHVDINENEIVESIIDETDITTPDYDEVKPDDLNSEMIDRLGLTHVELLGVLNQVPEPFKIVFNLHCIEHFKHEEIAVVLNIDINTSRTRLLRARKLIKQLLYRIYMDRINQKSHFVE